MKPQRQQYTRRQRMEFRKIGRLLARHIRWLRKTNSVAIYPVYIQQKYEFAWQDMTDNRWNNWGGYDYMTSFRHPML